MIDNDDNPLRRYLESHRGRVITKWLHYFDVYHALFARYRGQRCTIVEFGIGNGGSLALWRNYFGPAARIVGVDIDPACAVLQSDDIDVVIADQENGEAMKEIAARYTPIDIVIDDGGHSAEQQRITFDTMFPAIAAGGVYLCEDTHTSYWAEYGGGVERAGTFIERTKSLIDQLHAWHSREPERLAPDGYTRTVHSIHIYDSIVAIEKRPRTPPVSVECGSLRLKR